MEGTAVVAGRIMHTPVTVDRTALRIRAWIAIIAAALLAALPASSASAQVTNPQRVYFPETGHYLSYGFLDYWRHNGAIELIGYPISEEFGDAATGLTVQYFERAVLEYHPEAPTGWTTQGRRLGALLTADRQSEAPFQPISASSNGDCTFYGATNHRLCFGFRDYWQNHGGLRMFGYPISEEFTDPANGLTTRYFERARFEYHPDNPARYQVLLGLLGDQAAQQAGVSTAGLPASADVPSYAADLWAPQTCRVWQIGVRQDGGTAAAGSRQVVFLFQNLSQVTCATYGYAGMQMLDAQGNPLPTQVHWGGGPAFTNVAPRTVVLDPGETASFAVGYSAIPSGDQTHEQACPEAARLAVTPPDEFDHLIIPGTIAPCEGDLYVSPIVAGVPWFETSQP